MTAAFLLALAALSVGVDLDAVKDQNGAVLVQIGGPPTATAETQQAIVSALAPLPVTVAAGTVPAIDVADIRGALAIPTGDTTWLAQVYVDSSGQVMKGAVTVFVVDWRHGRLFMRSLRHSGPIVSPLIREQVVQIVVAAVGSLLAGQRVGEDREMAEQKLAELQRPAAIEAAPAPPAEAIAAPAPTNRPAFADTAPSWLWTMAAGYAVRGASDALTLQHGPTMALAVQWRRGVWSLGPLVRVAYFQGAQRLEAPLAIRLSQWPLGAGLGAGWRFTPRAWLHAAAMGAMEPTVVHPAPADPQVMPADRIALYIPGGAASAGLDVAVTQWFRLRVDVGVNIDASQRRFVIQSTAGPEETLRLWRAKPWGAFSLVLAP